MRLLTRVALMPNLDSNMSELRSGMNWAQAYLEIFHKALEKGDKVLRFADVPWDGLIEQIFRKH